MLLFAVCLLGALGLQNGADAQILNCDDGRNCTLYDDGDVQDCTVSS